MKKMNEINVKYPVKATRLSAWFHLHLFLLVVYLIKKVNKERYLD